MRKNMCARTRWGEPVADGAHVQFAVERAKEPFDVFKSFVTQHHIAVGESLFGQAGAQHVDAVQGGFGVDLVGLAGERERLVGDLDGEVFGHLVVVDDLAGPKADGVAPAQGAAGAAGGGGDFLELFFGGRQ